MATSGTDWMPATLPGKRAMFENIFGKIAAYAAALGLLPADVTAIQKMCSSFISAYDYTTESRATAQGLTEWLDDAMYGDKGKELPSPPAFGTFTNDPAYVTGIIAVMRGWRERWVASTGYTEAIGEDLMVVATKSGSISPDLITPTLQAHAAQSGYLVALVVADRADSDQWTVEVRQNGGAWKNAGTFTGKSADITITPTNPGQPEQVEIRVQLRRKNANYGNLSQIATVTVNP
jgi:hypothetical protein